MQISTTKKIASGVFQGLLGSIGGRFVSILSNIIAARFLGPAIFGLYGVGWTLLRFLSLILPMGMDRCFLKFGPEFYKTDDSKFKGLIFQVLFVTLFFSSIFGILLFLFAPVLSTQAYRKPELLSIFRFYSLILPAISLLIVASAITRITQKMKFSVLIQDLGQPIIGLTLMVFFLYLRLGLNGVVISDVIAYISSAIFAIWIIFRVFSDSFQKKAKYDKSIFDLLNYSVPAALGGAFSVYIFWIDRILIGYFRSSLENGIYLAISQISTLFLVISSGINGIVVPVFSDLNTKRDWESLNEVYKISTKWGIYLGTPFFIVLCFSPYESLVTIYGESFVSGIPIMIILLIGQFINLLTGSVNPLLMMTGNQKTVFSLSGTFFAISLVLNILFIPKFGMLGAAIITSSCISALYLIELIWTKKELGFFPFDKRYFKGLISFGISFFSIIIFKHFFNLQPLISFFVQLILSLSTYFCTLIILRLDEEDKEFLFSIITKLKWNNKEINR